jgi:hypothetical protein
MNTALRCAALMAVAIVGACSVLAQEQEEETIDLLKAPASPGSNMLGIAPEEIQRPTDLTSFMVSLRQASNGFTQLPANYSIDLAPCWLFPGKGRHGSLSSMVLRDTTDNDVREQGTSGWGRMWQSLVVSTAVANLGSTEEVATLDNTKAGFGLKLSLVTPKVDDATATSFKAFTDLLEETVVLDGAYLDTVLNRDPVYSSSRDSAAALTTRLGALRKQRDELDALRLQHLDAPQHFRDSLAVLSEVLSREIVLATAERSMHRDRQQARKAEMRDLLDRDAHEDRTKRLQEMASGLTIEREGLFLDLSAGLAIEFVDRDFDNGQFRKGGLWFSGGYTCPGFTLTGLTRTLWGAPVEVMGDDSTLAMEDPVDTDIGLGLAYDKVGSKFAISGEFLMRWNTLGTTTTDTWRLVANAAYSFQENKALTFTFGRNFDGTTTEGGNLVAALNLLLGFGGGKKVEPSTNGH